MKINYLFYSVVLGVALAAGPLGCSTKTDTKPIGYVEGLTSAANGQQKVLKKQDAFKELPATALTSKETATVTLRKSEIFDRDFLYSIDLQYSSIGDSEMSLMLQSIANEHMIARFRKIDDKVQIIGSTAHEVESESNAPERLITEFKIISEDRNFITVQVQKASFAAEEFLKDGPSIPKLNSSWVRHVEYDKKDDILLMETSAQLPDGKIAAFMESIFPRENIVKKDSEIISANPEMNDLAARLRFLTTSNIYTGSGEDRMKTKMALRYSLHKDSKPLEWFVTPSIPDQYLPAVQAGVEGWNRYSQKMWGKDFIKFAGKLPVGIKIGDPRFNVINWDNVAEAGAAYESQGYDPITGIQSHSLVYLPLAWVNIGKAYWERGSFSGVDKTTRAKMEKAIKAKILGSKHANVNCFADPEMQVTLGARTDAESFGKELLRQTLFHEIGHALGFAHNFKGSLSYDTDDASTLVTSSVMDYNLADERKIFDTGASTGPLLEYDRQFLEVVYNKSDLKNDKVMPACEDDEADQIDGGVDPLCIRYDLTKDPVSFALKHFDLLSDDQAKSGRMMSLSAALKEMSKSHLRQVISNEDDWKKIKAALKKDATALTSFYIFSGAQSMSRSIRSILKELLVFSDGAELHGLDEKTVRMGTMDAIDRALNMASLPDASKNALLAIADDARVALAQSTYGATLGADQLQQSISDFNAAWAKTVDEISGATDASPLGKMKLGVLGELKFDKKAVLFMDESIDMEQKVISALGSINGSESASQMIARVEVLGSMYKPSQHASTLDNLKNAIQLRLTAAKTAKDRTEWRKALDSVNSI